MKFNLIRVFIIGLTLFLFSFSLVGCDNKSPNALSGNYHKITLRDDNQQKVDESLYFQFRNDKTFTLHIGMVTVNGTYIIKNNVLTLYRDDTPNEVYGEYSVGENGNTLTHPKEIFKKQ